MMHEIKFVEYPPLMDGGIIPIPKSDLAICAERWQWPFGGFTMSPAIGRGPWITANFDDHGNADGIINRERVLIDAGMELIIDGLMQTVTIKQSDLPILGFRWPHEYNRAKNLRTWIIVTIGLHLVNPVTGKPFQIWK